MAASDFHTRLWRVLLWMASSNFNRFSSIILDVLLRIKENITHGPLVNFGFTPGPQLNLEYYLHQDIIIKSFIKSAYISYNKYTFR